MKILTKYFDVTKLSNEIKNPVIDIAKDNNISEDSVNFIRKGLETYKEPDFNPGERSVITYISTGNMDRDGDIVLPSGVDLTYYNKHPVVMWAHNYKSLPIGRCAWIKSDPSGMGLIAKTLYATTPEADLIYNYRKDGFFLCTSIGFVPTKYVSAHDIDKKEEFASELQTAVAKGWITKDKIKDVKNIIQKWSLIEFSDVSIPANPAALTIAVNKGLIKKEELEIVEDKSIQIEELKPYKTIIQIDGLKDMNKEDIDYIEEDAFEEIKTVVSYASSPKNEDAWDGSKARNNLAKWASSDNSGDKEKINWEKYKKGFAYYTDKGEKLGDFALPHHDIRGGKFVVVRAGVRAALAAIGGARGANIPPSAVNGAKAHLEKHAKQFGMGGKEINDEIEIFKILDTKTKVPPTELITKEGMSNIEQKKSDKKGNPSVDDIRNAIYVNMKQMKEDMDKMHTEKGVSIKHDELSNSVSYMGIEDLYPIEYPNGHVVCCYCSDHSAPMYFYDYKYKYNAESKTCEMGKMTEMEIGYNSKGICKIEIENLSKVQLLKSDLSKIEIEQLKDIEEITLTTSYNLVDDNGHGICLFSVDSKLYKTKLHVNYINGAEYVGSKNLQVDEHFSKFISTEAKSMEEWSQIKYDLRDFYLKSTPGKEEMLKFCKEHNLQHKDYLEKIDSEDEIIEKGVEETENEIRIRVQDSSLFDQDSFRYKTIKSSKPKVKAVFGKKKGSSVMELQSYRFPKSEGWTKQSAKAWVKEHGKKSFDWDEDVSYELPEETIVGILQANNKNMVNTLEEILGKILGKAQI